MGPEDLTRSLQFEVDDLALQVGQCRLTRCGQSVPLTKLNFLALRCLVEAAPNVVSHAQLASSVWGTRRVVTPENLGKRILLLRQALGDTADHPRYIEAVRGLGYRMVPDVRRVPRAQAVTARLIDARWSTQLWSDDFDGETGGAFAFQDEIVARLIEQLRLALSPPVTADQASNPAVYNAYLRARHINRTSITTSLPRARSLLEWAVAEDPHYFPVRKELAATYNILYARGLLDRSQAEPLLRSTISDATAIWPERPEIDFLRAWFAFRFDADFPTAARYFEEALRRPANLDMLTVAMEFAILLNRPKEAVEIGEYVLERDPICYFCYANLSRAYYLAKRYDRVAEVYLDARALGFDDAVVTLNYGLSLLELRDAEAALEQFESMKWAPESEPERLWVFAMAYWLLQRQSDFEAVFAQLLDRDPILAASAYAFTGDLDAAFEIFSAHPPLPLHFFDGRVGDVMRAHPRWPELARKTGIGPEDPREAIRFELPFAR